MNWRGVFGLRTREPADEPTPEKVETQARLVALQVRADRVAERLRLDDPWGGPIARIARKERP